MKFCFHINHRLSTYCEGVVSQDERARIEAHLASCAGCRARSQQMQRNIHLLRQLPLLEPTDDLWSSIASAVSASSWPEPAGTVSPVSRSDSGLRWALRAAIVTTFIIIATALLLFSRYELLPGSYRGELDLAGYLDLVATVASAETGLREFPAAPGFTRVSWPEARAAVNFPAVAPESLPGGYRLTGVRLYTCGDLRALQLKYRSEQGGLCVFQLPASSELSLGELPSEKYKADGIHCRRASSRNCSIYRFVLGETQYALMMRPADSVAVRALIQTFNAEYEKLYRQGGSQASHDKVGAGARGSDHAGDYALARSWGAPGRRC